MTVSYTQGTLRHSHTDRMPCGDNGRSLGDVSPKECQALPTSPRKPESGAGEGLEQGAVTLWGRDPPCQRLHQTASTGSSSCWSRPVYDTAVVEASRTHQSGEAGPMQTSSRIPANGGTSAQRRGKSFWELFPLWVATQTWDLSYAFMGGIWQLHFSFVMRDGAPASGRCWAGNV